MSSPPPQCRAIYKKSAEGKEEATVIAAEPHAYNCTSSNEQASTMPDYVDTAVGKAVNPSANYQPLTIGTTEEESVYEVPDDVKTPAKKGGHGKGGKTY